MTISNEELDGYMYLLFFHIQNQELEIRTNGAKTKHNEIFAGKQFFVRFVFDLTFTRNEQEKKDQ